MYYNTLGLPLWFLLGLWKLYSFLAVKFCGKESKEDNESDTKLEVHTDFLLDLLLNHSFASRLNDFQSRNGGSNYGSSSNGEKLGRAERAEKTVSVVTTDTDVP